MQITGKKGLIYCTESNIFLKGCGGLTVFFPPFQCTHESLRFTLLKKVFGFPRSPGLVASGASWRVSKSFPLVGLEEMHTPLAPSFPLAQSSWLYLGDIS